MRRMTDQEKSAAWRDLALDFVRELGATEDGARALGDLLDAGARLGKPFADALNKAWPKAIKLIMRSAI